jgi:lipoyl-dependent peroxiredoxin
MSQAEKLLYTAKVHTTGGRESGTSRSDDGRLAIKHSVPGAPGNGTNPEPLFAAGWSTCLEKRDGDCRAQIEDRSADRFITANVLGYEHDLFHPVIRLWNDTE